MKEYIILLIAILLISCKKEDIPDANDVGGGAVGDAPVVNFPMGWIYTEYPSVSTPGNGTIYSQDPCTLGKQDGAGGIVPGTEQRLIGDWNNIKSYEGAFFRTEGGLANPFNNGADSFSTFQSDTFQAHRHGVGLSNENDGISTGGSDVGGNIDAGSYSDRGGLSLQNDVGSQRDLTDYSVAGNSIPRMGNETRPKNYTVRLWKKTGSGTDGINSWCVASEVVEALEYREVITTIKDKSGVVLGTETRQEIISAKPKLDENGNPIYRIISGEIPRETQYIYRNGEKYPKTYTTTEVDTRTKIETLTETRIVDKNIK